MNHPDPTAAPAHPPEADAPTGRAWGADVTSPPTGAFGARPGDPDGPPVYRHLGDRARLAVGAVVALLVVSVAASGDSVYALVLLEQMKSQGATSATSLTALPPGVADETIQAYDAVGRGLALLALAGVAFVAYVLAAVATIRWQLRARDNLEPLGAHGARYGRRAGAFSWFVPIWNLFGPKVVLNDLWRGSDPEAGPRVSASEGRPPAWLLAWWVPWLATIVLDRIVFRGLSATTVGDVQLAEAANLVSTAVLVLSGVFFLRLIRTITARQGERAARLAAAPGG